MLFHSWHDIPVYTVSKKWRSIFFPITLAIVHRFSNQNYFTITFRIKFATKILLCIPLFLNCVATLPCEKTRLKNSDFFTLAVHDKLTVAKKMSVCHQFQQRPLFQVSASSTPCQKFPLARGHRHEVANARWLITSSTTLCRRLPHCAPHIIKRHLQLSKSRTLLW